jgi:hypothetical protein
MAMTRDEQLEYNNNLILIKKERQKIKDADDLINKIIERNGYIFRRQFQKPPNDQNDERSVATGDAQ